MAGRAKEVPLYVLMQPGGVGIRPQFIAKKSEGGWCLVHEIDRANRFKEQENAEIIGNLLGVRLVSKEI